jgi:ribosome-associated protein|tara:strand:- start:231 stop:596 length:366 start_codon:yes stop_codon:yes gene_type:complete
MSDSDRYPEEVLNIAKLVADDASERLASDIVILDTRRVSGFSDYFVIITGETTRHLQTMSASIARIIKGRLKINHREGLGSSGWVLLDYSGLIIHLMTKERREYYDLEGLWSNAVEVLRMQ